MQRSRHLDGLRAIAILFVALYHYAWFWAPIGKGDPLLPYGDLLSGLPLARIGYLGVQLFFIISGCVITLSLVRSRSVSIFAGSRLLRLWPTLLLCGALTFAATSLLGPAELTRSWPEALISLSFVPPSYFDHLGADAGWQWLDGAYWSLWTEVRFYIIAAAIYFTMRPFFLTGWILFATVSAAVHLFAVSGLGAADALSRLIFAEYQPYFSAGIALAYLASKQEQAAASMLLAMSWILAVGYTPSPADLPLVLTITFLFAVACLVVLRPGLVPFLGWRPLATLGQASYSYYLLHQNFGLALLIALPWQGAASVWAMLLVQIALMGLSILILRRFEQPMSRRLKPYLHGNPKRAWMPNGSTSQQAG